MALVRIDWNPRLRLLRQLGLVVLPIAGAAAAAVAHWKWHNQPAAIAALAVAAAGFLVGLVRPSLLRPLFVGLNLVTFPIGWVASYLLLTLLFFAVFVPAAAIMKLAGRDPMTRALDRSATSYWLARKQKSELGRYFRQF